MKKTRRTFIKGLGYGALGVCLDPINLLLANQNPIPNIGDFDNFNGYFVSLFMPGGPPRWMFDLLLEAPVTRLSRSRSTIGYSIPSHPMVITKFNPNLDLANPQSATGLYETIDHNNYKLPPIWDHPDFAQLLNNWVSIRGIDTIPEHKVAMMKSHNEPMSANSLQTFVTDTENTLNLGPIQLNIPSPFLTIAKKELGSTNINNAIGNMDENVIEKLLKAFLGNRDSTQRKLLLNYYQNILIKKLKSSEKANGSTNLNSLYTTNFESKKLFNKRLESIAETYPAVYQIYKTAVTSILDLSHFPQIDDDTIINPWEDLGDNVISFDAELRLGEMSRYNGDGSNRPLDFNGNIIQLTDFRRNLYFNSQFDKIISSFAMCDVLIRENLSNSLILNMGGGLREFFAASDGHFTGSIRTLHNCTKYFGAILNCLAIIKDRIGTQKFSNTVFQLTGDFNRTPRLNEEGSDHDASHVVSFFTGKVTGGPYFGGKARVGARHSDYGGNYGSSHGLPPEDRYDNLSIYETDATFFGTSASGRTGEDAFYRNASGNWSFRKALENVILDEDNDASSNGDEG